MPHPQPPVPTNANPFNDYPGIDRGLFKTGIEAFPYARLYNAVWTVNGPAPSPGVMQFSLMGYATLPVSADDYKAGTILKSPTTNLEVMDCITRGPILAPILAEFYARDIWKTHYSQGGDLLTTDEKAALDVYSTMFIGPFAEKQGLETVKMTVSYEPTNDGMPVVRGYVKAEYTANQAGVAYEATMFLVDEPFDPVLAALADIRSKRQTTPPTQPATVS